MQRPQLAVLLSLLLIFIGFSTSQSQDDQVFCSRLYHSSIIVNNTLYIDGGELRTLSTDKSNTVTSTIPHVVDIIDLSKPWSNNDTSNYRQISKINPDLGPTPPTLNDGSIFSNGSSLYLFGGALSSLTGDLAVPPPNDLYHYDLLNDHWSKATPSGDSVKRIHIGTAVQSNGSIGYYLGGAITPKSDAQFLAEPDAAPYMVEGLISFNETSVHFKNSSTAGMNKDGTVADSFLVLIESLGQNGVLITFGGFTNSPGQAMNLGDTELEDPTLHMPMENIAIYDIGKDGWYQQEATGDVPPFRYLGCSTVVSAPDDSSHSIYVYGGWSGNPNTSDGDVYVLSIPSFRWIRVTENGEERSRHKCHLMGNHTMLVVGGNKPFLGLVQPEDIAGCDRSANFAQGLGMFSLNNHTWMTTYNPAEGSAAYKVHPNITKVIGGDENGNARIMAPLSGFAQKDLIPLLGGREDPPPPPSPVVVSPKHVSAGRIAGIVIGALLFVFLITGAIIFYILRRRRRRGGQLKISSPTQATGPPREGKMYTELYAGVAAHEMGSGPHERSHEKIYCILENAPGKPLPPRPVEKRNNLTVSVEPQEMYAGSPRFMDKDTKAKIASNAYI